MKFSVTLKSEEEERMRGGLFFTAGLGPGPDSRDTHTHIHMLSDASVLTHTYTHITLHTLRKHSWTNGQRSEDSTDKLEELQILVKDKPEVLSF